MDPDQMANHKPADMVLTVFKSGHIQVQLHANG